ncbi:MAG: cytochrome c oxidase accessory protein CcoG [Puniceicoccales bacterium]|jgi:cytochrome c oxidase accessory protein FixG|nr:cytochrome c oxidase accessory protein CcoG [Puniceicoccales bacterium]
MPAPIRDSVTSINKDGSRNFIHPADVRGKFTTVRKFVAALLIAIYIALPWIKIGGNPAVFLDIAARRFHLFGITLSLTDIWYLFFAVTGLGILIFFTTALLGRIWCGWTCPQTVFLDFVFRRIERWLEGDRAARRRLDKTAWADPNKIIRRGAKIIIFFIISALIAHIFLSYFVSLPALYTMMSESPLQHWGSFVFVSVATLIFFFNFYWFREQLCIIICPYGRFQSVLIDDDSLVVGYDAKRGEPRGKPSQTDVGDCVDCHRCVQVCPTGIDIRQGLQIECVSCSACIDACNEIMDKLKRPRGLIRYDSMHALDGNKTRFFRPRIVIYGILMLIGAVVASIALSHYSPASLMVTRMPGDPYTILSGTVQNRFKVRLINKSNQNLTFSAELEGAPAGASIEGFSSLTLAPQEEQVIQMLVGQGKSTYTGSFPFKIVLKSSDGKVVVKDSASFSGPSPEYLQSLP